MQFILSLFVGLMLVTGQTLWKLAVNGSLHGTIQFSELLKNPMRIILSPTFLLGCAIYVVATVLYIYVISRYNYGISYAMIVACSTVLASAIATLVFKEAFTIVNVFGLALIIAGVTLISHK